MVMEEAMIKWIVVLLFTSTTHPGMTGHIARVDMSWTTEQECKADLEEDRADFIKSVKAGEVKLPPIFSIDPPPEAKCVQVNSSELPPQKDKEI